MRIGVTTTDIIALPLAIVWGNASLGAQGVETYPSFALVVGPLYIAVWWRLGR